MLPWRIAERRSLWASPSAGAGWALGAAGAETPPEGGGAGAEGGGGPGGGGGGGGGGGPPDMGGGGGAGLQASMNGGGGMEIALLENGGGGEGGESKPRGGGGGIMPPGGGGGASGGATVGRPGEEGIAGGAGGGWLGLKRLPRFGGGPPDTSLYLQDDKRLSAQKRVCTWYSTRETAGYFKTLTACLEVVVVGSPLALEVGEESWDHSCRS